MPEPAGTSGRYLAYEAAVPLLSFGGALLGVLAVSAGSEIDLRFTAAGCVLASCVLAYLAWVRPKKDIVSLTTPIYSIIFFAVPPGEPAAVLVLEFLYAASLLALLVRLRARFGSPAAAAENDAELSGALGDYAEKVGPACAGLPPAAAHRAAGAFLQYSAGDYAAAGTEAAEGILALDKSGCAAAFATAFEIVREQAEMTEKSRGRPSWYRQFSSADERLLARPLPPARKATGDYDEGYDAALDAALLLLFAGAWNASQPDRARLMTAVPYASRILADQAPARDLFSVF